MASVKYKNGNGWFTITNSGLKATETTYGVAKIATLAQVEAGLADDVFVTPAKIGTVFYEKNHGLLHFDWIGTLAEYNQQMEAETIDPNWICFITDDEITESLEWGNITGQITLQTDLIEYIQTHCAQFPTQTSNSGKYLKTNGSTVSWDNPKPEIIYWD